MPLDRDLSTSLSDGISLLKEAQGLGLQSMITTRPQPSMTPNSEIPFNGSNPRYGLPGNWMRQFGPGSFGPVHLPPLGQPSAPSPSPLSVLMSGVRGAGAPAKPLKPRDPFGALPPGTQIPQ